MGCDRHGKKRTVLKGGPDRLIKAFAGDQVFIVPDSDIPELRIFMNEPHQELGMTAVFFPVAEKNIGIKRLPHSFRQIISYQHGVQKCLQNFLVRRSCRICKISGYHLDLRTGIVDLVFQPVFQCNGEYRKMRISFFP